MNPKLIGTWFLVKNHSTEEGPYSQDTMIVKADSVTAEGAPEGSFRAIHSSSGWMSLDKENDGFIAKEYRDLTPADFNALKLPKVTVENSPLEIEIMPSGNVYFY